MRCVTVIKWSPALLFFAHEKPSRLAEVKLAFGHASQRQCISNKVYLLTRRTHDVG